LVWCLVCLKEQSQRRQENHPQQLSQPAAGCGHSIFLDECTMIFSSLRIWSRKQHLCCIFFLTCADIYAFSLLLSNFFVGTAVLYPHSLAAADGLEASKRCVAFRVAGCQLDPICFSFLSFLLIDF
jgi:hypothetical protein